MGTKKAHINTPQEKAAIRKTLVAVLIIIVVVSGATLIVFSAFFSPDHSYTKWQKESINKAAWLKIIPGSTWKYSDSSFASSMLPSYFKNVPVLTIGEKAYADENSDYSFKVKIGTETSTTVGILRFTSSDGGMLILGSKTYEATFSDMSSQQYDENRYMLRITINQWGSIDFFYY